MRAETLKRSIDEAKRFIEAAGRVKLHRGNVFDMVDSPSKEAATCKRASMDLTRVLADLRRDR